MKMKLEKSILHSVVKDKKGLIFLFEILFVGLLLLTFIIGYQTINLSFDYTKIIMYTKAQDLFTAIVAKNITDAGEIEKYIKFYFGDVDYYIKSNGLPKEHITDKKNCISKNIPIWCGFPVTKQTIFVKICF